MYKLNELNDKELELFKDEFPLFKNELLDLIDSSGLFEKSIGDYKDSSWDIGFYFRSKRRQNNITNGIILKWDKTWSSLRIEYDVTIITYEKILGIKLKNEKTEYLSLVPVFLNENSKGYDFDYEFFEKTLNTKDSVPNLINEEITFIRDIFKIISQRIEKIKKEVSIKNIELSKKINSSLSEVDKDNNGEVDLIDGESFNKLLNKHQKSISNVDNNYIQKFVKISLYLKNKKKNTQLIFESITDSKNEKELDELMSLLKNQIHTYELLVFHSISMITSLVESDLITFYEIYESFDQLGVFNSNWENEVSNKLSDIGDGIKDLMYSINKMEYNIVNSLETLNYTTQESFSELNDSISSQLSSIDSSINFNNLLTGIQTYQMYKINQNTKRIS